MNSYYEKNLSNFNIKDLDFILTYSQGEDLYNQYLLISKLLKKIDSIVEIGNFCAQEAIRNGAKESVVKLKTYFRAKARGIKNGRRPISVQALDRLKRKGFMPFNIRNPYFQLLTFVGSANFWKGGFNLNLDNYESEFSFTISGSPSFEYRNSAFEKMIDLVGQSHKMEKAKFSNKSQKYKNKRVVFDPEFPRFFKLMGLPVTTPADGCSAIAPDYILMAINTLEVPVNTVEELVARTILYDFVLAFLFFRPQKNQMIYLKSFKEKEMAKKHALLIQKLLKIFFEEEVVLCPIHEFKKKKSYHCNIKLTKSDHFKVPVIRRRYFERLEQLKGV